MSDRTETLAHHSDIQAALDAFEQSLPDVTRRASNALVCLLQRSYDSPSSGAGWFFSRLTGDGFPLEFIFSSSNTPLRYTVDFAGAQIAPAQSFQYGVNLLRQLGQPVKDQALWDRLSAIQQTGPLNFGAWIGGRHTADTDSFKLYAEVPLSDVAGHAELLNYWLPGLPIIYDRKVQLRMIGYEPERQQIEFYFRAPQLDVTHVPQLLRPMGLEGRAGELAELIANLHGYPLREQLPGGSSGFSYSVCPGQADCVFTLFLFARALWGDDAHIRPRVANLLKSNEHEPSTYLQFTHRLAERKQHRTYHGLVGLSVRDRRPVQISIGVRPPPHSGYSRIGRPEANNP